MILFFSCATAQEFVGYVKKLDSIPVAIFQAKVEIREGNDSITTLKTYFDGSYRFIAGKSKTYKLHVTHPGYTDTTFSITTDKKGNPSPATVTVILRKDGMRLLGVIKSKEDDFPIKGATISVKNVMTRKEDRVTTGIDGYYNVRLEYETMYRVSIDKRSPGVMNKYRDTTFYLSTVGFNQPFDYRLDIVLEETEDKVAPNPDYKPVPSKATKPVVEVTGNTADTTKDEELATAVTEKKIIPLEREKEDDTHSYFPDVKTYDIPAETEKKRKAKRKRKQPAVEMVVIGDNEKSPLPKKGKRVKTKPEKKKKKRGQLRDASK
ncbi:MAG: hypothetical protein KIS94_08545 [Chitinophagales bacterium]|nr:hypothetical protein [Chitinophagales bacterium]